MAKAPWEKLHPTFKGHFDFEKVGHNVLSSFKFSRKEGLPWWSSG